MVYKWEVREMKNEELRIKNEELPCGVLALRSQILHSSLNYHFSLSQLLYCQCKITVLVLCCEYSVTLLGIKCCFTTDTALLYYR